MLKNKILDISSLVKKTDFDAKLKGISDRVTSSKSKNLLVENKLKKLEALDLSYFGGKNYFDGDDGTQNMLVFQVKNKYFERNVNGPVSAYDIWESKSLSNQRLSIATNSVKISKLIKPAYVIFSKKDKLNVIATGCIVNIYIVYKLSLKTISSSNTLKNCLFCAIEVKKPNNNTDPDKWQYSSYGLAFDRKSIFTQPDDNELAR